MSMKDRAEGGESPLAICAGAHQQLSTSDIDSAIEAKTPLFVLMQPVRREWDGSVLFRAPAPAALQHFFTEQFIWIRRDELLNSTAPLALTRA